MRPYSSRPSRRLRAGFLARLVVLSFTVVTAAACDTTSTPLASAPGEDPDPLASRAGDTDSAPAASAAAWRAGFVIVDGVYNTELMAPYDVFEHTAYQKGAGAGIEVITISPDGNAIRTAEGLRIEPDHGFDDAPRIDILVVPSSRGSRDVDLQNEALISFVRERGERARLVVSLCWGAFVLARSGLLDGRAATTFPSDYVRFTRQFPDIDLRVNVSFVHDDRFLTSQGGVESYDVAMYLVDLIFGEDVAAGVGRGLLIPWPRSNAVAPPPFVSDTAFRLARPEAP